MSHPAEMGLRNPNAAATAMDAASATCAVCGGALQLRFPAVFDVQTQERFSIQECRACGLGQTAPQPPDLSHYYADGYYGGRHGFTATYCAHRRTRWLKTMLGAGENRTLLDVGCGDGTFLLTAQRAGWRCAGIEINPEPARMTGLEVFPDLASAAAFGPFDCITFWHSLEHMQSPRAVLQDCKKLMKQDGVLLLAVPDASGLQACVFGARWIYLDVPRHLFHFSRQSLARLLESAGFTSLRNWHQEFEYDLLGWTQSGLNAMGIAPNLFFSILAGRSSSAGRIQIGLSWLLGVLGSALALPLVALGTLLHRGGTLVVAARPE